MKFSILVWFGISYALAHDVEPNGLLRGNLLKGNISSCPPSGAPTGVPVDSPSGVPSTQPAVTIYEEAVQRGLDELNLLGFTNVQKESNNVLTDSQGVEYSLNELKPYSDIFSPDSFSLSKNGKTVKHKSSNVTIRIPIFRSLFDNNTVVVQVSTTDTGNISFAEIRGGDSKSDTFFVNEAFASALLVQADQTAVGSTAALLSFTANDIDEEKLASSFTLGLPDAVKGGRDLETNDSGVPVTVNSSGIDTVSAACQSFTIVKIAVVYDSEMCGVFGSADATRSKIVSVVASASLLYERGLCVKLQLTDIYTPDATCGGKSKTFGSFDKENICGGSGLIYDFSGYMAPRRNGLGFDKNAIIHLFTGIPKLSSTIGCAFTGGFCTADSFGVVLATFSTNTLVQAVVFAHEIGHNLNAKHITDSSKRFNYIMEGSLTSGSDGFDQASRNSILGQLAKSSCDSTDSSGPKPTTGNPNPPVPAPTPATSATTVVGCRTKPEIPTASCIFSQRSTESRYACFSVKEILPPFCSTKNLRWVLETCNGASLRKSARRLEKTGLNNASTKNTTKWNASKTTQTVKTLTNDTFVPEQTSFNRTIATVNGTDFIVDNAVTSFDSNDCTKSCVFTSSKFVCLDTSRESHLITVIALNGAGKQVDRSFRRIVTVKATNDGTCRPANVECVE